MVKLDLKRVYSNWLKQLLTQLTNLISHQVVYVARNPKDVIVSYYYHHRLIKFHYFDGDLESFAHRFMQDQGEVRISLSLFWIMFTCFTCKIVVWWWWRHSVLFAVLWTNSERLGTCKDWRKCSLSFLRRFEKGTHRRDALLWCDYNINHCLLTCRIYEAGSKKWPNF